LASFSSSACPKTNKYGIHVSGINNKYIRIMGSPPIAARIKISIIRRPVEKTFKIRAFFLSEILLDNIKYNLIIPPRC
jgi:hypothetical protein